MPGRSEIVLDIGGKRIRAVEVHPTGYSKGEKVRVRLRNARLI
jgi:hypothetical protein